MVIDSLHFALGGRVNKDFLRKDTSAAMVEALFSTDNPKVADFLEENGIVPEQDGSVLISRVMQSSGKTIARVKWKYSYYGYAQRIVNRIVGYLWTT